MMTRSCFALAAYLLPACLCAQLKINEVSTQSLTASWIEIINLGSSPVNMTGYKIRFGGNSGLSFNQGVYTVGAVTLNQNQVMVITEDVTATVPSVPAGVFKAYCGAAIPWNTATAVGANGCVALNDPADVGLDRMRWGNPLQDFSTYGSPFTGSITPSAHTMFRISAIDNDVPADWGGTTSSTPGVVNPGEVNVIDIQFSTVVGTGSITVNVLTAAPAVPGGEIYNLVSFYDYNPDGTGPLFGIGADALLQPFQGPPFHVNLDGAGNWGLSGGPGTLPVGLHLEAVSLLIQGGAITRISTVEAITL